MRVIEQLMSYLGHRGLLTFDEQDQLRLSLGLDMPQVDDDIVESAGNVVETEESIANELQGNDDHDFWLDTLQDQLERAAHPEDGRRLRGGSKGSRRQRLRREAEQALQQLSIRIPEVIARSAGTTQLLSLARYVNQQAVSWTGDDWLQVIALLQVTNDTQLEEAIRACFASGQWTLPQLHKLLSFEVLRSTLHGLPTRLRPLVRPLLVRPALAEQSLQLETHPQWAAEGVLSQLGGLLDLQDRLGRLTRRPLIEHLAARVLSEAGCDAEYQALGLALAIGCWQRLPGIYRDMQEVQADTVDSEIGKTWLVCCSLALQHPKYVTRNELSESLKSIAEVGILPQREWVMFLRRWSGWPGIFVHSIELHPAWQRAAERLSQQNTRTTLFDPLYNSYGRLDRYSEAVRGQAIASLRTVGCSLLRDLIDSMGGSMHLLNLAEFLAGLGTSITPPLIDALSHADAQVRNTACRALSTMHSLAIPAAVPGLITALKDADKGLRRIAAEALGLIGSAAAEPAVPGLITALKDEHSPVRSAAAVALGKIGSPTADSAVPGLITALSDEVGWVRGTAAEVLSRLGSPAAAPAVPALIAVLSDPDGGSRHSAVEALGSIGSPAADPSVPGLIAALSDSYWLVRRAAAKSLGKIGSPAADPAVWSLTTALTDPDEDVRKNAAAALGNWK